MPILRRFKKTSKDLMGAVRMRLSTEFASEHDLLDRVMDKGIVVEVWDQLGLAAIDMAGMRVTVSSIRLFTEGRNPPFRAGYFWKVDPS
ncbi:MAG TPA: gas vesicle protein GvpJ [Candidatus Angelobacter sp.]